MRQNKTYLYIRLFLLGVLLYLITVLPFVVYHGGVFFYYGDYNVQQVPFYVLGNRMVKSGNLFWTWSIDLGTSWLGSFAMYLSGSPFFYLSCLFPEGWVPYLMPLFMALKYGTALCTAYAYAETILPASALSDAGQAGTQASRYNRAALVAALLYGFSGWSQTNIVFQHFHEAYAFWPLYLLVFDRLIAAMRDKTDILRKGLAFALMTAFMSVLNYYFFFGQVLFLVLYYLVRYCSRNILREVPRILGYAVLGVALAAWFLVQVYDMISGNTRLADTISGLDCVIYKGRTTPLVILKSLLYLPDLVGRGTLYTNDELKNSQPGLYLPLFAIAGVLAYCMARRLREDWMKRLLLICALIAFVPVLNAAFNMFNDEYYSRWYYMPILFMAIATAQMLAENDLRHLQIGTWICAAAFVAIAVSAYLPVFSEIEYRDIYNAQLWISAVLMLALFLTVCVVPAYAQRRQAAATEDAKKADHTQRKRAAEKAKEAGHAQPAYTLLNRPIVGLVIAACLLSQMTTLYNGNQIIARTGGVKWRQQLLDSTPGVPDASRWCRIETDGSSTNYELVWGYPTVHSFQSTIPGGAFDFWHGIGYNRTVNTKLAFYRVGARALTSVRYYYENRIVSTDGQYSKSDDTMPGYEYYGVSADYDIYEQTHFIPMGFTFDSYITEERYTLIEETNDVAADRLLVRDLILSDEDAARYGHLFANGEDEDMHYDAASDEEFLSDCDQRAASACTNFAYTKSGFTATSDNENEALVFFSVPYDDGFTAYIDGEKVDIVCADYGLMAVDVPAGEHEITFTYQPAYLNIAAGVSVVAGIVIIIMKICSDRNRYHT